MRKVFLDELPRRGKINQIDWKKSVGYKGIKFIYDNIEGEIEIIGYNNKNHYINIKYNNILPIHTTGFLNCNIGKLFIKGYKYNIGDIIETKSSKLKILEQIKINYKNGTSKGYIYECLIDGYIGQKNESDLIKGTSCPICTKEKVLIGYNDLWTTRPDIAKLLKYPKRGYELSQNSGKTENFICPNCSYEKAYRIASITRYNGFSCPHCGDGISYPNKFIRNFLKQVGEEFIPEYLPNWSQCKRYDNFLINKNEIWEVQGSQHYEEIIWSEQQCRNLKGEQENDKLKKDLAEQNGCKYIIIDARCSDMEYIKKSLLSLSEIKRYNINNVDWNYIDGQSLKSFIVIACDYWNGGIRSTIEIANIMKLHSCTISEYLKRGNKLGWCKYSTKEVMRDNAKKNRKIITRSVVQLSKSEEFISEWDSIDEAGKVLSIFSSGISATCKGKLKTSGGFKWMYKEDYDKLNIN